MKKTQLLIGVTLMLAAACSKKDNGTTPSGTISTTISTQIAKTDTLSTFNKFFAAAALSDAELSEGVTVFAPSNSAFGNATVSGSGQLPDESVIKDYIVKGVLTEADFTKGKTLTTLSGKTLTVSVVVDPVILVNGMILNMNAVGSNDKFKVYGAAQLLNAPAPVFITVYDATKWSSLKTNGEVIAGATVGLYKTQESFAAGNAPDYSALSAADGVAVVNGVKPGRYYVAAGKGTLSNIFSVYAEKDNDNYIGYAASDALDAQGNFVWKDLNQDGQVNGSDVGPQPALSITTQKSLPLEINVLTGYLYKPITTLDDARTKLNAVYSGLTALYTNLVLMDGVLSDEAACGFNATYCPFNTFTMTASTSTLNAIWNDSYFKGIHKLNDILYNIDGITGSQDEKNDVKGQALALRGYLYSNLLTYFGEIPVSNSDRGTSFYPGISRTTTDDVYKMIEDDFDDAIDLLPASRADNKAGLTKYAAYALLAKVALQQHQYYTAMEKTTEIKNAMAFTLAPAGFSWFQEQTTSETIWAPVFSNIGAANAGYFDAVFKGINPSWIPVLRYSDVLLMDAEANIGIDNIATAQTDVNLLRERNAVSGLTFTNTVDATEGLQSTWQTERTHQGDRFASLVRWNRTEPVLGQSGWHSYNNLMPVPINFLNSYPGLMQNVGY